MIGAPIRTIAALWLAASALPGAALAHDGPPFPIVSDRVAGPYEISIWTDPDTTDDGSPGGQFWLMLSLADGQALPADTRATVTIKPLARTGPVHSGEAAAVDGNVGRQFVALVMDHEGPFAVNVEISGSRGPAAVDSQVDATYDLRPPPILLAVYLLPFVAIGFLWVKLLRGRRRRASAK